MKQENRKINCTKIYQRTKKDTVVQSIVLGWGEIPAASNDFLFIVVAWAKQQ